MMRQTWRHLRIVRTLTLLALTLTGGATLLRGEPSGPDPVKDLEKALRQRVLNPKNEEEIAFRKKTLQDNIDRLRKSDLRRAIALIDWQDRELDIPVAIVDRDARQSLIDDLAKILRERLDPGSNASAAAKLAAIAEVAEMGTQIRSGKPPKKLEDDYKEQRDKFEEERDKIKEPEKKDKLERPQKLIDAEEKLAQWTRGGLARQFTDDLIALTEDRAAAAAAVRQAAARALGKINPDPKPATDALEKMLKSKDAADRRAAADGLLEMLQSLHALRKSRVDTGVIANNKDIIDADRYVVAAAGPSIGDVEPAITKISLDSVRLGAFLLGDLVVNKPASDLRELPASGRPWTDDERTKVTAYQNEVKAEQKELLPVAEALAKQVQSVLGATKNADPVIRLAACHTLEEMGQARLRLLLKTTTIPEEKTGGGNKAAPEEAKDDPLLKALLGTRDQLAAHALSDARARIRLAAVDALETLGTDAAPEVPKLARCLEDSNLFVRWASARVIGKIGAKGVDLKKTVPLLARLLDDSDLDVELAAANALGLYGEAAKDAVPALARTVGGGDPERRVAAIRALQNIGTKDAWPAIPEITAELAHKDPRVRRAAAEALGPFGPNAKSATRALEKALNDIDPEVRKAAADALLAVTTAPEKK